MTGRIEIDVSTGLVELLDHPWVADHVEEVVRQPGNPHAGQLTLTGVTELPVDGLVAAAPQAGWQAYCGQDTLTPNLWVGYHPTIGLAEADHVDGELVVTLTDAHAAAHNPHVRARLDTLTQISRLLDAERHPAPNPDPLAAPITSPADPLTGDGLHPHPQPGPGPGPNP
ncbi:MAG: hypothetical protein WCF12_08290 [Propionicimonas sp.]